MVNSKKMQRRHCAERQCVLCNRCYWLLGSLLFLLRYGSIQIPQLIQTSRIETRRCNRIRDPQSLAQVRLHHLLVNPDSTPESILPRFLREEDERPATWDERLAEKYYSSLYREFAVCDLKHYKSGNVRNLALCHLFL